MDQKTIKESYVKLLDTLKEAGVILSESQTKSVDSFISDFETKMEEVKSQAVRETTEKLNKDFQRLFESVMKHKEEHDNLASMIQEKVQAIKESRQNTTLEEGVENFLDQYVSEILPKKTIVDYDRMAKLERIVESVKDTLVVTDSDFQKKREELTESFDRKAKDLESQIEGLKKELTESKESVETTKKMLRESQDRAYLMEKTENLPEYEQKKVSDKLKGCSKEKIDEEFDKVLKTVKEEMAEDAKAEPTSQAGTEEQEVAAERNLDEEIDSILEKKGDAEKTSDNTDTNVGQNKDSFEDIEAEETPAEGLEGESVDGEEEVYETEIDLYEDDNTPYQIDESVMKLFIKDTYGDIPQNGQSR